jgi:membrane protein
MIRLFRDIVRRFRRRQLLIWATSLAYNALWAVPPLILLLLALAGFFDLKSAWKDHLGPDVRRRVTPETWTAVNSTVERILGHPHAVWVLVGVVLAGWHVSGLVRASQGALNAIFDRKEDRGTWERIGKSIAVAGPVLVLVCLAVLVVLGGRVIEAHGAAGVVVFLGRWLTGAVLMWAVLAILIRTAPAARPRAKWVSIGAALAIGGWIGASLVFGVYVGYIADFKSPYGNLISVMVLMGYLYWLSLTFLVGVLADEVLAERSRRRA